MDAVTHLLTVSYRHVINEPNIEAGYRRFASLTGGSVTLEDFYAAVAFCLREGLIREPVRLPEGALQCHWHLELTPEGVTAAKALPQIGEDNQSGGVSRASC